MSKNETLKDSLVLYRNRPARIIDIGKKIRIEVEGGETVLVRPKDIDLLHPGPCKLPIAGKDQNGDIETAWELLAGRRTTLEELAELAFGEFTPSTAWAAWQVVDDGQYFQGQPDDVRGQSAKNVEEELAARAARAARKQAWDDFVHRLDEKALRSDDDSFLKEVADLGMGSTTTSAVLRDMGRSENPETAHAFLLETGYWDSYVNPHPARLGMAGAAPNIQLPDLAPEDRIDLTHLEAVAIDDQGNRDPDD
ncbi:MAG: hypothetical protein JXA42_19630, partial [Anaerolineales bacterium]|nr:hypothetical protein [Anaerolineales bacterium]